jgi:hypothetical protein
MEATENKEATGGGALGLYPNVSPLVVKVRESERYHEFTGGHVTAARFSKFMERRNQWKFEDGEIVTEDFSADECIAIYDELVTPHHYTGPVPASHKVAIIEKYLGMVSIVAESATGNVVTVTTAGRELKLTMRRPSDAEMADADRIFKRRSRNRLSGLTYNPGQGAAFHAMGLQLLVSADGYENNELAKVPAHHVIEAAMAVCLNADDAAGFDLGN